MHKKISTNYSLPHTDPSIDLERLVPQIIMSNCVSFLIKTKIFLNFFIRFYY